MKEKRKADESSENVGKRITPRKRGGFSNAGLSDSSSSEGVGNINDEVMAEARRSPVASAPALPRPTRPTDPHSDNNASLQSTSNEEDFTPGSRLDQVRRRAPDYEREYRMGLLHRLLMRNIPLDEIAAQLQVSIHTVQRDRLELFARLRQSAKELNIDELVGHHKGVYEEVGGMALRAASNAQTPIPMRLAAMRTALAANNDMHRFFQAAGVYDVLRFRRAPGGDGATDIQRMLSVTEELLSEARREERTAASPNPLGEFSGGDSETMEL